MMFKRKDRRRAQIVGYMEYHATQMILLDRAANMARTTRDHDHVRSLIERTSKEEEMIQHYNRLLVEHDAGLSVELPGEGGW